MGFTIRQGSSEGILARIIHRTMLRNCGVARVDVEGSIHKWVMLLGCEDEKGGFAAWSEKRHRVYCQRFRSLHNIHYQTLHICQSGLESRKGDHGSFATPLPKQTKKGSDMLSDPQANTIPPKERKNCLLYLSVYERFISDRILT